MISNIGIQKVQVWEKILYLSTNNYKSERSYGYDLLLSFQGLIIQISSVNQDSHNVPQMDRWLYMLRQGIFQLFSSIFLLFLLSFVISYLLLITITGLRNIMSLRVYASITLIKMPTVQCKRGIIYVILISRKRYCLSFKFLHSYKVQTRRIPVFFGILNNKIMIPKNSLQLYIIHHTQKLSNCTYLQFYINTVERNTN